MLHSYKELLVWQKGMQIAEACYILTRGFPKSKIYGMTSQIRRAGSEIPANIAEGYGRGHRLEYVHFVRIANGSLNELENHLLLSVRVSPSPSKPSTLDPGPFLNPFLIS